MNDNKKYKVSPDRCSECGNIKYISFSKGCNKKVEWCRDCLLEVVWEKVYKRPDSAYIKKIQAKINKCVSKIAEHQIILGDDKIVTKNKK